MKREPHSRLDIGLGGKGRESIPVDVFLEEGGRGRNPELGFCLLYTSDAADE